MRQYLKLLFLFASGGLLYNLLELFYRGWTHWTMFFLGGLCFVALGAINEVIPWDMPLWQQVIIGAGIITTMEFIIGCIVNLWLGWDVWDYSHEFADVLGQICPLFSSRQPIGSDMSTVLWSVAAGSAGGDHSGRLFTVLDV